MNRTLRRSVIALLAALSIIALSACEDGGGSDAQSSGQALTEQAFDQQQSAVPYPVEQLTDSTERRNVAKKLLRTNDPNRQGYIYIFSHGGEIVGYYAIKGKVSSTQSQMTASEIIVDRYEGDVAVTAPGDDGSYGQNEDGVFFFTTEDVYVTTNLDYIESDQPLPIDVQRLNPKA